MVRAPGFRARVLHAFPHAVNLLTGAGAVVTLADPTVGDGPLNVVVDAPAPFVRVPADAPAWGGGPSLHVDGLTVALSEAAVWEPRWTWERRRECRNPKSQIPNPQETGGLPWTVGRVGFNRRVAGVAQKADEILRIALRVNDQAGLAEAAAALAGLGPGLTPAGDDFLAGVMWGLRFWPNGRDVDTLCAAIVEAAAPRTTPLSAALLRAAGAGLADARWHALFDALDRGRDATAALRAVLAQGATSGADAWAGFQLVSPETIWRTTGE